MDAAGGSLRIASEVGRGTTVKLFLPALGVEPVGIEPSASPPVVPADRFEGHVLVAEDNDDVAAVTTALIASLGLRVTRAANASEALQVLHTPELGDEIGFLLTDVVMPGELDGVELALKVRAERPALPITVITGYAENVQAAQDAELDVVQKPLALEALLARFRAAFPEAK
jgi:CheY-like chemotaxis protein